MHHIIKLLSIIIIIGSGLAGCKNWNRFHQLNCHEINKITIRIQYQQDYISQKVFMNPDEFCRALGFLQKATFSDTYTSNDNKPEDFLFHFAMDHFQDKAFIFTETAFIGKTQFGIRPGLPGKLYKFYLNLDAPEEIMKPLMYFNK